jgi:alpha-tubulin suppressor-like RCC1 family protein
MWQVEPRREALQSVFAAPADDPAFPRTQIEVYGVRSSSRRNLRPRLPSCQDCVADLGLGRRFGCTLRKNGTIWCSGDNSRGQLGIGIAGNVPSATPAQVRDATSAEITNASDLGTDRDHACVVRPGGEAWCWGANNAGQLGDGTTVDKPAAVRVVKTDDTPLTGIVALRGGENHTCARDNTDAIWCWGGNSGGQLGDGTLVSRSKAAPVLVAAGGMPLAGALELLTGAMHNCVRNASNEVWCWGVNNNGQLGDGSRTNRSSPVKVYTSCRSRSDAGTPARSTRTRRSRAGVGDRTGGSASGPARASTESISWSWRSSAVLRSRGRAPWSRVPSPVR